MTTPTKGNRFSCLEPASWRNKTETSPRNHKNRFLRGKSLKTNSRWQRPEESSPKESSDNAPLPTNSRWNFQMEDSPKNTNSFKGDDEKNDEPNDHYNSFRRSNLGRRNNRNSRYSKRRDYGDQQPGNCGKFVKLGLLNIGLALKTKKQKQKKSPVTKTTDTRKRQFTSKFKQYKKKNDESYSIPSKDNNMKKRILAQYELVSESEEEDESV